MSQEDPYDKIFNIKLPKRLVDLVKLQDGLPQLMASLPKAYPITTLGDDTPERRGWESCGFRYVEQRRFHEAFVVFQLLYQKMFSHQLRYKHRIHKGVPLYWMYKCHEGLQNPVVAKRYLMMAFCEDAISDEGVVDPAKTGSYSPLVSHYGLYHDSLAEYAKTMWALYQQHQNDARFPEWVLQELDQEWMIERPYTREATLFVANTFYVSHLLNQLGQSKGTSLERLAHYLITTIPGCRAKMRQRSPSTDYDVVGIVEGNFHDFRSEIGRYFLCECKDWKKPADFTAVAKFCRVLESTKTRFGIMFSKNGLSGAGKEVHAHREQLKAFQAQGIVVVVITNDDLKRIAKGLNLITLLRDKYEQVRFDLKT